MLPFFHFHGFFFGASFLLRILFLCANSLFFSRQKQSSVVRWQQLPAPETKMSTVYHIFSEYFISNTIPSKAKPTIHVLNLNHRQVNKVLLQLKLKFWTLLQLKPWTSRSNFQRLISNCKTVKRRTWTKFSAVACVKEFCPATSVSASRQSFQPHWWQTSAPRSLTLDL